MAGEQDMRHMGGLKGKISITYWTFFVGCLAIAGVPPFAGFFSKDEILWRAWAGGHTTLWALGMLTAGMTAFYMFRLFFMTFHGEARSEAATHAHESPPSMTGVLVTLAVLSVVGGLVGVPHALGGGNHIEKFLEPAFGAHAELAVPAEGAETGTEILFSFIAVFTGLAGIGLAWFLYVARPRLPQTIADGFTGAYRTLLNKYYVDEIYQMLVVSPLVGISRTFLWQVVDVAVIDGTANGMASGARGLGGVARRLQGGHIRSYAAWVLLGAVFVLFFLGMLWAK
jgi:NADH-quinone oxidoreductase subunit L